MNRIQIYSDGSKTEGDTIFIVTNIWGWSKACHQYEQEMATLVKENRGILGKDFKKFHASKLGNKNWNKISSPYIDSINKLFSFIKTNYLNVLIFIESNQKHSANSKFLKDCLKENLLNRNRDIVKCCVWG